MAGQSAELPTILYLWDMGRYWQCRWCNRAWRKKDPLSVDNWLFLSNHVREHMHMTRRRPQDIPGYPWQRQLEDGAEGA